VVYVRRESQRAIVLGKGGERIRAIREDAQKEMAQLMERPIHLFLFVKVRETWPDDPERYKHLGLDWTE
jgi:GTP-binding protein Era